MAPATDVAAIIPCLNEERTIAPLVGALRDRVGVVVVVDDGSSDETAQVAERAGALVLRNDLTHGKGAALHLGWSWAHQHGFAWALCIDGDGQHAPADLPEFLEMRRTADLIIGNRMGQTGSMPPVRRWVNWWMSRKLSSLAGCHLPDTQCGYRLMRLEHWARLELRTLHYEVESEVLLAFLLRRWKVGFVPIQTIYSGEKSRIRPWHDTLRWFRWLRHVRQAVMAARASSLRSSSIMRDPK